MKHGLQLAPFGHFSDPNRLVELAQFAEESGWDGVFLWDHVLRLETRQISDPWVSLAAMATVTQRIRLGTMVTPVSRRRPIKLALEVATLDRLSQGRITLGLGLGVDSGGELTRFGEVVDPKERGDMLDEGADLLSELLQGRTVDHHGPHFEVDGVGLDDPSVQQPRPPFWFATRGEARKPVRRAARFEGIFPIEADGDCFARIVEEIATERGDLDGFDIAIQAHPDGSVPDFVDRGATWILQTWPALADPDDVAARVAAGPPR